MPNIPTVPNPPLKKITDVRLPDLPATSSFKINPYKTCIYLLLLELEKKQDRFTNDRRSYYSFCMWTLIGYTNLSFSLLKFYVYQFMNDFEIFDAFISVICFQESKDVFPNSENLFFNQKIYPKFVRQLSIIGFFVRNFEAEFLSMDTKKRFQFMRDWSDYLKDPVSDEDIVTYSKEWNIDLEALLKDVVEAEASVEKKRPPKRLCIPTELDFC
ncbi:hypothetical protein M3Y97_00759300 [Aphelenchoides bicaudatus]|nr:hypothetical protein M3Y97_00759300 [Aphelenchoides bicaudatus]